MLCCHDAGAIRSINFTAGNTTMTSISDKDGMVFELTEGQVVPLTCYSVGGNPKPNVHIYMDSQDITGQFDEFVRLSS